MKSHFIQLSTTISKFRINLGISEAGFDLRIIFQPSESLRRTVSKPSVSPIKSIPEIVFIVFKFETKLVKLLILREELNCIFP